MADQPSNPDITVRGGLINVPDLTSPTQPPRHQPDTPRTKKETTIRSDHIPTTTDPTTKRPRGRPPNKPPPDEPETESPEVTKDEPATSS